MVTVAQTTRVVVAFGHCGEHPLTREGIARTDGRPGCRVIDSDVGKAICGIDSDVRTPFEGQDVRILKAQCTSSSLSPSPSFSCTSPSHGMASAKIKSTTSKVANAFAHPTIVIQKNRHISPASSAGSSPTITKTPKTPADDGIDFFESSIKHGEAPIHVHELPLEPDGGPSKSREVRIGSSQSKVTATLTNFI